MRVKSATAEGRLGLVVWLVVLAAITAYAAASGSWFLTAAPVGFLFGFFLQKGDLCGSSAMSEVLIFRDARKLAGLWVAIAISMVGFAAPVFWTGIMLIIEMTGSYSQMLPLLVSCFCAYAVAELMQQCAPQQEIPMPDWIVFATSSGGTQAGLTVGAKAFQYPGKILGISIDEKAEVLKPRVANLATQTADLLRFPASFTPEDILVNEDYLGGGYGIMSSVEVEAIKLFASHEGILLDPVYTGRSAGGMLDMIRKNVFPAGSHVLFWHTGGSPALFAEQYRSAFV